MVEPEGRSRRTDAMTLLPRKVDYALLLLCSLSQHPEGACARALADRLTLARPFVAKILKLLCRTGFLASQRGIKGGYVLAPAAAERNLAALLDALDDGFFLAECNHEPADMCCSLYERCPVKGPIAEVHRRLREVLEAVTLRELFDHGTTVTGLQVNTSRCEGAGVSV
jgi:Rrf2 family protein